MLRLDAGTLEAYFAACPDALDTRRNATGLMLPTLLRPNPPSHALTPLFFPSSLFTPAASLASSSSASALSPNDQPPPLRPAPTSRFSTPSTSGGSPELRDPHVASRPLRGSSRMCDCGCQCIDAVLAPPSAGQRRRRKAQQQPHRLAEQLFRHLPPDARPLHQPPPAKLPRLVKEARRAAAQHSPSVKEMRAEVELLSHQRMALEGLGPGLHDPFGEGLGRGNGQTLTVADKMSRLDYAATRIEDWERPHVVSWLTSVCHKRNIPLDRVSRFLPLKGAQLLKLSEKEFLVLEPSFGSFLYRDIMAMLIQQRQAVLHHLKELQLRKAVPSTAATDVPSGPSDVREIAVPDQPPSPQTSPPSPQAPTETPLTPPKDTTAATETAALEPSSSASPTHSTQSSPLTVT